MATTRKTFDPVITAADLGARAAEYSNLATKAVANLDATRALIKTLFTHKVKVGMVGKCPIATAFIDACVVGGIGRETARKTYMPAVRHGAETGEFSVWNIHRKGKDGETVKGKGGKATKDGKAKGVTATADVIFRAYRHDGFAGFCQDVQKMYDDDKAPSLFACVEAWLKAKGKTLPEAKTK